MRINTLKTPSAIYVQSRRVYAAMQRRAARRAMAAHPETMGYAGLVHNWGNDAARAAWEHFNKVSRAMLDATDSAYRASRHHAEHGPGFRPLWCEFCRKPRAHKG